MSQSNTDAVAFVLILAVPTFYYLALCKIFFETCFNIKIHPYTIFLQHIYEQKHFLTSSGSSIAYINHQAVHLTCENFVKNEKSNFENVISISRSFNVNREILEPFLITIVFIKLENLKYF